MNKAPSSRASRTIEKLKSPRPDKLLARTEAMAASEAMGLLEDALGADGIGSSMDDDAPFDPCASRKKDTYNQDSKVEIYASNDKQTENSIISAGITKKVDN